MMMMMMMMMMVMMKVTPYLMSWGRGWLMLANSPTYNYIQR